MYICVMVTTRGRIDALRRLLDSLKEQTYKNCYVLLGDQSSGEAVADLVSSYAQHFSIQRRTLQPLSLSAARNAILPFAEGEYIFFADDDCYLEASSFSMFAGYAQNNAEAGALVGRGFSAPVSADSSALPAKALSQYDVFRNCPSWCIFIKKRSYELVGEFDETLGIGAPTPWQSGEETDYLLRLIGLGQTIVRCPSLHLYHDAEDQSVDTEKIKGYSAGRMRIIQKHSLPTWFAVANIIYPLARAGLDFARFGRAGLKRRLIMFQWRLKEYFRRSFPAS